MLILSFLLIFPAGSAYAQENSENVSLLLDARFVQDEFNDIKPVFLLPTVIITL